MGLKATGSALRDAATLGFGSHEIGAVIESIERHHFHKSMTSYADHRVWQDVYHVPSEQADAVTEFLLLSLKEKGNG